MTRKTRISYSSLFKYIESNVCTLECGSYTTDYEKSMRNALHELHPESRMVSCWFHYSQALKRKASKIPGFIRFIRGDAKAETIYYKLQCMPLLPHQYILEIFNQLKDEALRHNKKQFRIFIQYMQRQWIEMVGIFLFIFSTPDSEFIYRNSYATTCCKHMLFYT